MFLNNIDFPNRILDAIRNNSLVVFAGAGASAGKPTSLPNFKELAEKIAEGTGQTIKNNDSCEVFLGALKANEGIDVNEIAAQILSGACLKHNALHEAIVDLFRSPEKVKIVTTNYDQMFEQVLDERAIKVPIYNSPALPLGSDITGIIHIHGNVCDPKYMIVTDEDFGMAYLTEGYATRFLVKLFESYTVLFIGYSYNDTILRYLTRAMSRNHSANRYILTDDKKSDWKSLGITEIVFPKRSYAVMRDGLVKLGNHAKKGLWDWQNQFIDIADKPPKDLTIETEIDYCLENADRSRVLAKHIRGAGWLELLDRKDVFSCCFSDSTHMDENGELWADWLSDRFVGNDDRSLIELIVKHGNRFSSAFSRILLQKIVVKEDKMSDAFIQQYLTLLDQSLVNPWIISNLIEITHKRSLSHLTLHLFEKLYKVSIKLERRISFKQEKNTLISVEVLEPKHSMLGDYHFLKHAWDLINEEIVSQFAAEVLSFVQKTIEEVYYLYSEMGHGEPWDMSMLVIEDREEEDNKEPLHVLVHAFLQAVKALGENEDSRFYIKRGLNSKSILLRKIALRAIRESGCFSDDEKIDLICDKALTCCFEGREQVFLLAQEAFKNASLQNQNRLLDILEQRLTDYEGKRSRAREVYDWCVWLKKTNPTNKRIESIIRQILSENDFTPCEHPERNNEECGEVCVGDKSPISVSEMKEMPIEKLATLLVNYKEDSFEGPTRWGLLNTFSECIKGNSQWATEVANYFYSHKIDNADIWSYFFQGLKEADYALEKAISWCNIIAEIVDVIPDMKEAARYLLKALENKEMQERFKENEHALFELSLKLWKCRETTISSELGTERAIIKSFNTTTGIVLLCWIHMVSYSNNTGVPDLYKTKFEEALQLNSWEHDVAVCILAGHFNFLCYRDRSWCINRFEPMLTGKNKNVYKNAWEGIVYFSRRVSKETADIMAPIFLKAVKRINWLEDEARKGFIDLYLTLLIFVVEKPTLKYIPEFYKASSEEIRNQFVRAVGNRLRNMDLEIKTNWWNSWLKRFLENRKSNKPVELTESECTSLFKLLPRLDFVIDDAVKILCKGSHPSSMDHLFWFEMNEKRFAPEHSHSIAKLLITLLNSIKDLEDIFVEQYIKQMVNELQGLEEKEQKQLQEALLKHGINVLPSS